MIRSMFLCAVVCLIFASCGMDTSIPKDPSTRDVEATKQAITTTCAPNNSYYCDHQPVGTICDIFGGLGGPGLVGSTVRVIRYPGTCQANSNGTCSCRR